MMFGKAPTPGEVVRIYSKFHALPPGKQAAILDAALHEFARRGYKAASTDAISRRADIAKGSLFAYFKSKRALYEYLYRYALRLVDERIVSRIDAAQRDPYVRLEGMIVRKLEVTLEHPDVMDFLLRVMSDPDGGLAEDLQAQGREMLARNHERIYGNIDAALFRPGVEPERAIDALLWMLEGYGRRELRRLVASGAGTGDLALRRLMDDVRLYIDMLRRGTYR